MRVLVILFEVLLVHVRVGVRLPVVAVFMLVMDVFMIMKSMGVRMRHIAVSVLVYSKKNVAQPRPIALSNAFDWQLKQ